MFARIIDWSIQNRLLVVLGTLFVVVAGTLSLTRTPIDAIPDLSDVQVIIQTEYPGQAPRIVEDQVTYPLTTQMLSAPFAQVVRGYSFFGVSFVYVIFEDGTDLYWARTRVLEYLNSIAGELPTGVTPELGPDATGVGWAFMYALSSDRHDLGELRSIQDWFLKYELTAIPGVSEVASVGGFVRQYQVTVDPNRLRAYDLPISAIRAAIRESNSDVGGGLIEVGEKEFMIRGLGYLRSVDDLRRIGLGVGPDGTPILLEDVARVGIGPEGRRGLAEWNGEGETVGGIIVVRPGADTRRVIRDVRDRLDEIRAGLPEGVEVEVAYDRTSLIDRAVGSIRASLVQQLAIVGIVCLIFLFHLRSGLVAVIALPVGILLAMILVRLQGLTLNIMSLGGIAVAIGTMVDAGIVMVENAHRHLARSEGRRPHWEIIATSAREVGPSLFFALLVITVSFMPVFSLEAQEGRLFKPLAFTKTYAMAAAALLSVTLVPVLVGYWVRGRIQPPERTPAGRLLSGVYRPVLGLALRFRGWLLVAAVAGLVATLIPLSRLGSEFMPPLWEGDLLYMPTTLPGVSITEAREILQQTDRIIYTFPEVQHVFGKVGRADSATDPAPLSMIETTIALKPRSEWRPGITPDKLVEELDAALSIPGLTNAWTMPIRSRIDMLSTGIRTPVGIKVAGPELAELERLGREVEAVVRSVPGTASVYADRVMGGNYLDFTIDRDAIARHGLTVRDVQEVIQTAIGGMNVTTTVEGLERYPVNLRYSRELRDDLPALRSVLVATPEGHQVPLGRLASMEYVLGPSQHQERGREAQRLGVRGHPRHRRRQLRGGGSGSGGRGDRVAARLHTVVERPIRISGARTAAAGARRPAHPPVDLRPHLPDHAIGGRDADGIPGNSVCRGRLLLAAAHPGLRSEHRGVGGDHRARWPLRRDRDRLSPIPQRLRTRLPRPRSAHQPRRARPRHTARVGQTRSPHHDDDRDGRARAPADHVERGSGRRRNEADSGSAGRRRCDFGRRGASALPGGILPVAGTTTAAGVNGGVARLILKCQVDFT